MSTVVDGITIPEHEFGTYGCLNIAKKYGVDYSAPLHMVHIMVFGYSNACPNHNEATGLVSPERRDDFLVDCRAVAAQTKAQRRVADGRAARGELHFIDRAWQHTPQESHS